MADRSSFTTVFAPSSLPFPITIQRLLVQQPHSPITKTQALFTYSFVPRTAAPGPSEGKEERLCKVYESPIEGQFEGWADHIRHGTVVRDTHVPLVYIKEDCTHDVQLHGLCALCGRDLTGTDYTGFSETSRAKIAMVHDVGGLTVSLEEASRLEAATTSRLLSAKKLSLIVDLDQTIVHATVDPTVGEWLTESDNPNHEALDGVKSFRLGMTSGDQSVDDGCIYYVKKRSVSQSVSTRHVPGLDQFLADLAEIYEMHVYTMGTRAYAIEVCNVIDPDGRLFGGRILSRDESGSLTRKSLQRLFPWDDHMVVIIDDRADVWDGVPNLVKVIPYEFFVGIGDINSAFLPPNPSPSPLLPPSSTSLSSSTSPSASTDTTDDSTIISLSMSEAKASTAQVLTEQIESRPLAAKALEQAKKEGSSSSSSSVKPADRAGLDWDDDDQEDEEEEEDDDEEDHSTKTSAQEVVRSTTPPPREAVLKDDDRELIRLFDILKTIRDTFYRPGTSSTSSDGDPTTTSDVKNIIPSLKRRTFSFTSLVFSGLVALGTPASQSEWWRLATLFGAHCAESISSRTTHLVAKEAGTAKVHQALSMKSIKVVRPGWLVDSIARWEKLDEREYLLITPDDPDPSGQDEEDEDEEKEDDELLRLVEEGLPLGGGDFDDIDGFDEEALRRMAEQDDLDAELEDVDWANAEKEIDDALAESEYDSDASTGSARTSSSAKVLMVGSLVGKGKKRPRPSSLRSNGGSSTDDEERGGSSDSRLKSDAGGKKDQARATSSGLVADSPLQKRVKTSRMRSSNLLKVSFPHDVNFDSEVRKEGGESGDPGTTNTSRASSRNGETSSELGSGAEDDDDDEAFFASMAEEVEKEWSGEN
ncbi:BZ3500_MvSof-1268-A1-R1_Chr7-2g09493 [Microbotryum saponariae]|uniref:RNA polymerase II subunit A C-terminal domain phosphatase n=1 Tax=Microbotryum saponariae TaxID=289078 RepID=A0A2X0M0L2_9BASI|nr:BZ3501_MvSof-1269-A2-R1_Chr7-1g09193 [Microbotryum saponariae]SDA02555.1 BZ3500_MvSof-1268-A1-R1_Chr7-2g09493 [Microbotryum saponariae]